MGVILYGTSMVSTMGTATLAAHEISRQVFILSIQFFSCLDVTAQSLVASQLGKVRPQIFDAIEVILPDKMGCG